MPYLYDRPFKTIPKELNMVCLWCAAVIGFASFVDVDATLSNELMTPWRPSAARGVILGRTLRYAASVRPETY